MAAETISIIEAVTMKNIKNIQAVTTNKTKLNQHLLTHKTLTRKRKSSGLR
jgi:hypothetical protein